MMDVEVAEANRKQALRTLLDLIYADEQNVVLTDPMPSQPTGELFSSQESLSLNYDYRGSLLDLAIAKDAITVSRSALLPALNLNAYTNWEWSQFPPSNDYSQWGISLEMLLFDFFKTPAKIGQAESLYDQVQLKLVLLAQQLKLAYRNRLDALQSSRIRYKLAVDNLVKAKKSRSLYQVRAQSYTVNSKQMLDAEQAALSAEINMLNTMLESLLDQTEMNRLLGRPTK
jgi:outer membrane protein TolC